MITERRLLMPVDAEVRAIIDKAFQRTVTLLERNREILDATAKRLLEEETLDAQTLRQIVRERKLVVSATG